MKSETTISQMLDGVCDIRAELGDLPHVLVFGRRVATVYRLDDPAHPENQANKCVHEILKLMGELSPIEALPALLFADRGDVAEIKAWLIGKIREASDLFNAATDAMYDPQ